MNDFNDYSGGRYINTAGVHSVKITDIMLDISKTGKPIIRIRFANQYGDYIDDWFVLQANTLFKIAILSKALGLTAEQRGSVKFDENRLDRDSGVILQYLEDYALGGFVNIVTEPREYEGKTYQEIRQYLSFTGYKRDYADVEAKFAIAAKDQEDNLSYEDVPF